MRAASMAAALVVVAAFAVRDRCALRLSLVPWRLLVLVPGMFLVLAAAMGSDDGLVGMLRSALVGAGFSNVFNNLPAYMAGETAVPKANHHQLLALLVGVNVGPVITPRASLATLLAFERCRWHGTRVRLRRFLGTGLVLSVAGTLAATPALAATA